MLLQFTSVLCLATALTGTAAAQQFSVVVGEGPATSCYQNAMHGRSDLQSLQACNTALNATINNRTDRRRTHVNRAVIYLAMDRPEQALADLDRAVRMNLRGPEVDLNYSAAYLRLGRNEDAIRAATRVLEADYHRPHQAYFNRAIAHESMGDLVAAYDDFSRASELAPDWPAPRRELERFQVDSSS